MTTTPVKKVQRKTEDGEAVVWEGDGAQARLLQQEGWIGGAALGDSKDLSGGFVLRGHVGVSETSYAIAYPGDYIVKTETSTVVVPADTFDDAWEETGNADDLQNDEEPPELAEYEQVPTGDLPRPPEQMPQGSIEQAEPQGGPNWPELEALAETADGEDESAAEAAVEQLTEKLEALGIDVEHHPADSWQEMVQTTKADVEQAAYEEVEPQPEEETVES